MTTNVVSDVCPHILQFFLEGNSWGSLLPDYLPPEGRCHLNNISLSVCVSQFDQQASTASCKNICP